MAADATQELRKGLEVRAADGRRLGTVVGLEGGALVVERGFFWPQRFTISRSDVGTVADGEVRLLAGAAPRPVRSEVEAPAVSEPPLASVRAHEDSGDVRVPLAREEAWPQVRTRDVGAVRVRKVVRTELKQFTVEVRREELVVERIPVQPGATDTSASSARASGMFEELEQVIPLWREDVEVVKRPVVYEEVHLKKAVERRTWTEEVPLRREEATVEEEGDTHSH
ncbi:YsnF/AvaK domain-containing protein [Archangium violaceum]|uniref:YsnF/AvaK domain-containing protein n=1 Tax=Archangium violaceum TaxID=83451 RepID=UPI00194F31A6|nr:YsnF/AvaK domain-containing protein [Archangium violaceum]QRN93652.1 YsnF/AvaK domain-containing protein [Archangium violaceum]